MYLLQPGLVSERVVLSTHIINASGGINSNPNPHVKFPIPNERELRVAKRRAYSINNSGTRKTAFFGNGFEVRQPSNLPFKPPSLQWQGSPCLITR